MKKTCILLFVLSLLLSLPLTCFAGEEAAEAPAILANMGILYEETTDTFLYKKNENLTNAPASMTKLMTATLLLDYDPQLEGKTTVSAKAISEHYCYWMDSVHLLEGEEVRVDDLLDYLLICSGNEAATVIAEYVAGDIDAFIGMMNQRAKDIGMERTRYFDPHGLSDDSRTTVSDMIKLAQFAMKYDKIREVVLKTSGSMPVSNMRTKPLRYSSTNMLRRQGSKTEYMTGFSEDIFGIKTGSTTAAGLNFCSGMTHGDLVFYSCVMHSREWKNDYGVELSGHMTDTAALFKWARTFSKYGVAEGELVELNAAEYGKLAAKLAVSAGSDIYILAQEEPAAAIELSKLKSIHKGDVVGSLTMEDAFGNVRSTELIAMNDYSGINIAYTAMEAVGLILLLVLFLAWRKRKKSA